MKQEKKQEMKQETKQEIVPDSWLLRVKKTPRSAG